MSVMNRQKYRVRGYCVRVDIPVVDSLDIAAQSPVDAVVLSFLARSWRQAHLRIVPDAVDAINIVVRMAFRYSRAAGRLLYGKAGLPQPPVDEVDESFKFDFAGHNRRDLSAAETERDLPVESPDCTATWDIRSLAKPGAASRMPCGSGVAEPVRMNALGALVHQMTDGIPERRTSCHSSISRGVSPSSTREG